MSGRLVVELTYGKKAPEIIAAGNS